VVLVPGIVLNDPVGQNSSYDFHNLYYFFIFPLQVLFPGSLCLVPVLFFPHKLSPHGFALALLGSVFG
jgi:hypothetical protein